MSKILIVSKTRLSNDLVCVGGIDMEKSLSVRLLDRNGYHETTSDCPYNIREVWEVEYISSPRPLPHSEDINVRSRKKTDILKQDISILDILRKCNFNVYTGSIRNVFEGKLKCTGSGSFYISEESVPQNSTCFWICDKNIARQDYRSKIKYNYNDGSRSWGYKISYVGLDENPAQIIQQGTLVRLSLAHWWSPDDSEDEERCYLQLSGWY
ncbi:MAG: hypothetical protein LBR10_00260 [Prevotellaceae bacterium]|jgi:hypothetical protein|nr:hypothetical protein [Prevotellaceae bacterium]